MVEFLRREAFGLLRQGNAAQVTGHDPQAQPELHPVLPVIAAFPPTKVPPQTRNPPLDTPTPPLAALPARRGEGADLLAGRHLLAVQPATACLGDHALGQW